VVSDVKTFSEGNEIDPEVYQAFQQRPVGTFSLILRADVDPGSLTAALRLAVAQMDAELPLLRVMTMEEVIDYQRYGNPLFEKLLATFSLLALILAAVGIHGLIAYSVSQRTHEIGIRLALGASAADIVGTVLRRGLWVAAIGSAIGLVLGLPMPRLFDAMFVGLRFGSAVVYAAVAGTMLVVVVFATLLPARRAARVNPVKALRAE
jgi:putative ABC transport system permease protein